MTVTVPTIWIALPILGLLCVPYFRAVKKFTDWLSNKLMHKYMHRQYNKYVRLTGETLTFAEFEKRVHRYG